MAEIDTEGLWVVLSTHDGLWWRPKASGYTQELLAAGVVDEATAKDWAHRKSPDSRGNYQDKAMSLTEALKGLGEGTVLRALLTRADDKTLEARMAAEEIRDAWVPKERHGEWPWEM